MDWSSAEAECKNRLGGASLAIIQNKESEQLLSQLVEILDSSTQSREEKFQVEFSILPRQCIYRNWNQTFMLGQNILLFGNLETETDCFNECWQARSSLKFECKSIVWSTANKECLLSEGHTHLSSDEFKNLELSREFRVFEDVCHNETGFFWATATTQNKDHKDQPPFALAVKNVRNCFNKHQRSNFYGFVDEVLIEISERECLSHCIRLNNQTCKTVIYYRSQKQCILTNKSLKTHPTKLIKQQPNSDVFERRLECQFDNCEDLELSLIFAIDAELLSGSANVTHTTELLKHSIQQIGIVTEFYRLTLLRIELDGTFSVLLQEQQFADHNELATIIEHILNQPIAPFVSKNLLSSLWPIIDFTNLLSNNTDVDSTWLIILLTGAVDEQEDDLFRLRIQLREAEQKRNFSTTVIGIGDDFPYDQLLKLVDERSNRFIYSQNISIVADKLAKTVCTLPKKLFIDKTKKTKLKDNNNSLWIGLKRNQIGEVQWSTEERLLEYESQKLRTLDIFPEKGLCVQWNGEEKWEYERCSRSRRFACTLKPNFDVYKHVLKRLENQSFKKL